MCKYEWENGAMGRIKSYRIILELNKDKTSTVYRTASDFYAHSLTMGYNSLFTSTGSSTNYVLLSIVKFLKQYTQFKGVAQSLSKCSWNCYYAVLNLVEEVRIYLRKIDTLENMKWEPERKGIV